MTKYFNIKINWQVIAASLAIFGVIIYILYKAINLSFTHDESYTYLHYVHQSFMDIISYKTPYTNNHILNTVCMKYGEEFFGSSELILRLPNILAFVLYSLFAILFLRDRYPKQIFPFFLMFIAHPYLLEFFALARGYGLSIGFLIMTVFFINRFLNQNKQSYLIGFNAASFLAVMSNFSLLNYYVASLIAFNLYFFFLRRNSTRQIEHHSFWFLNKVHIVSLIISAMVLYEPLRRLSKIGLLDFGGKRGVLADTVGSSIDDLFYETAPPAFIYLFIQILVCVVCFGLLMIITIKFFKNHHAFFSQYAFLIFINLALLTIVILSYAQHLLLGNDFYVHRFALFLYPLFLLNFFAFLNLFSGHAKVITIVSYALAGLLLFNFYINNNLHYFKDWKYDKDTKLVMQQLATEHVNLPDFSKEVGINWLFEPTTNFYRYIWDLNWMLPTHRNGISGNEDFWYLFKNDPEFARLNGATLFNNEETAAILLKNNKP